MGWFIVERNLEHENHYTPNDLYHANGDQSVSDEDIRVFHQVSHNQTHSVNGGAHKTSAFVRGSNNHLIVNLWINQHTHTHMRVKTPRVRNNTREL